MSKNVSNPGPPQARPAPAGAHPNDVRGIGRPVCPAEIPPPVEAAPDLAEIVVADCCECGGGKALIRVQGVWLLLIRAGDGVVVSNGPVHACPHCGAALTKRGQTHIAIVATALSKTPIQPEAVPLAPTRPYRWSGLWDTHLTQCLGVPAPDPATPFVIAANEEG